MATKHKFKKNNNRMKCFLENRNQGFHKDVEYDSCINIIVISERSGSVVGCLTRD